MIYISWRVDGRALGAVGGDKGHEGRLDAGSQQAQHVRVPRQHCHGDNLPLELHSNSLWLAYSSDC